LNHLSRALTDLFHNPWEWSVDDIKLDYFTEQWLLVELPHIWTSSVRKQIPIDSITCTHHCIGLLVPISTFDEQQRWGCTCLRPQAVCAPTVQYAQSVVTVARLIAPAACQWVPIKSTLYPVNWSLCIRFVAPSVPVWAHGDWPVQYAQYMVTVPRLIAPATWVLNQATSRLCKWLIIHCASGPVLFCCSYCFSSSCDLSVRHIY
jgi:hypothetical protein